MMFRWMVSAIVLLSTHGAAASEVAGTGVMPYSHPYTCSVTNGSEDDVPTIGGCPMLPADSPWNTPVAGLPVKEDSEAILSAMEACKVEVCPDDDPDCGCPLGSPHRAVAHGSAIKLDAQRSTLMEPVGMPFACVDGSNPALPWHVIDFHWWDESDIRWEDGTLVRYPIPPRAPIEGGRFAPMSTDRHLLVVDTHECKLYEVFHLAWNGSRFEAGSGRVWDLYTHRVLPDDETSADAAGLPILPGVLRYEEYISGDEIHHAFRFTTHNVGPGFVAPASHGIEDDLSPVSAPPMGTRLRLKADFDESGFPEPIQRVLRALKTYGMILSDRGSGEAWISTEPSSEWDDCELHELDELTLDDFEVV